MEKDSLPLVNDYRPNKFVINVKTNNGWLLYNTITGGIVAIDNKDDLVKSLEQLEKMFFYVPREFDELSWVDKHRESKINSTPEKGLDGFTIFTTMDCNARCFYCYESGQPQIRMTERTACDVAEFIIRNSAGSFVNIRWFGGEPLLNIKVIDLICDKLKTKSIQYKSTMISNGLLFSDQILLKAKDSWNLRSVQITLDGTKDVYQKAKAYKKANGDEFERVISNVHKLVESGIRVSIRLNQDFYNTPDLIELVDFLSKEFKGKKRLSVYNNWLYDEADSIDAKLDAERYAKFKELQSKLIECHLYSNNPLRNKLKVYHCMADNDSSVIITPKGDIGKCEHYTNQHLIGNVCEPEFNDDERLKCKEKYGSSSKCYECPLYPQCVRIKICPAEKGTCSLIECENKIELIKRALLRKCKSKTLSQL